MSRKALDPPATDRTTIETSKTLLDRVTTHVKKSNDNLRNFVTRALVNQLEKEGDFEIRLMLEEENENEC